MVKYLYKKNKNTIKNRYKNFKTKKNVYKSIKSVKSLERVKSKKKNMLGGANDIIKIPTPTPTAEQIAKIEIEKEIEKIFSPPLTDYTPKDYTPKDDGIKNTLTFIEKVVEFKQIYSENNKTTNLNTLIKQLFLSTPRYISFVNNNETKGKANYKNIGDINTSILIIYMHGETIPSLFRLPDNINIVFVSPISYLTCTYQPNVFHDILEQIKAYNADNKSNNFFTNPICFNKEKHGDTFSQSVLYLGGQYCPDLVLYRSADTAEHVTGIHYYYKKDEIVNISANTKKPEVLMPHEIKTLPDWTTGLVITKLSIFLQNAAYFNDTNIKFTIFIISCRSIVNDKDKDILVLSEQITTAINFKISLDIVSNITNNTNNTNAYKKNMFDKYNDCFNSASHFTAYKKTMDNVQRRTTENISNMSIMRAKKPINIRDISTYTFKLNTQIADIPDTYLQELIKKKNITKQYNGEYKITFKNLKKHSSDDRKNFFILLYLLLFNTCDTRVRTQENNNINYQDFCINNFIKIITFIFKDDINRRFEFIIFYLLKSNAIHKYAYMFIYKVINKFVKSYPDTILSTIHVLNLSDLIIQSYSLLYNILNILNYLTNTNIIITELQLDNIDLSNNMDNFKKDLTNILQDIKNIKTISIKQSDNTHNVEITKIFIDNGFTEPKPQSCVWVRNDIEDSEATQGHGGDNAF